MTTQNPTTFEAAYREMQIESQHRLPSAYIPDSLSLSQIKPASELFQPRQSLDIRHIRSLATAINNKDTKQLDPLVVWWSGKEWRLLDGYHRLEAYKKVTTNTALDLSVSVTVFDGELPGAMAFAIQCNSKDKLPMKPSEKSERAWKLLALKTRMKHKEIYESCGISKRLMAKMASELRQLPNDQNPLDLSWREVLNMKTIPHDADQIIEEMLTFLKTSFGKKAMKYPNYFAEAITLYSQQLAFDLGIEFFPNHPQQIAACMHKVAADNYLDISTPSNFFAEVTHQFEQEVEERNRSPF